jgi:DNA-directed RNA polymerase subunit D
MKLIEKKDNQITFEAEIIDSLANAIRRSMNQIPLIAVDEIEIFKNDSPLYDETVSHRIGLIPLKMSKSLKKKPVLKLSSKKEGFVYSSELGGEIEPVYDKIPITYLNKGQELEFNATTVSGTGNEHAKFSPGLMFYREISQISLDKEFSEEVKKACPNNDISEKGAKLIVLDNQKNQVEDICENIAEKNGKKAEVIRKEGLILTLESFGQLAPEDIFNKAVEELKKNLNDVSKQLGK